MALNFQPPEWLIQEYMKRKQPGQIINEGAQQAMQTYLHTTQMQKQQEESATGNLLKAAELDPQLLNTPWGKNLMKQSGGALEGYQPPSMSTGTIPSPAVAGVTPPGAGQPTVNALPTAEEIKARVAALQKRGGSIAQKEIGKIKTGLDVDKSLADLAGKGPLETLTKEQALKNKTFDPAKQIILEPPTARDTTVQDQRHDDRMARAVTDYGKQIENHPVIKKLNDQQIGLDQVEEMSHLVNSGNSVASSALGTKMAKAMGEVGVLTESDIKRYVQSGKLAQGSADTLSRWISGKPTEATMKEIGQISAVLKDSFASKVQPIYDRHIDRFSRAYKMKAEEAAHLLALPYAAGKVAHQAEGGSLTSGEREELAALEKRFGGKP